PRAGWRGVPVLAPAACAVCTPTCCAKRHRTPAERAGREEGDRGQVRLLQRRGGGIGLLEAGNRQGGRGGEGNPCRRSLTTAHVAWQPPVRARRCGPRASGCRGRREGAAPQ